jgi:hypothetical protein
MIQIGKKGRIIHGDSVGSYVMIQNDHENTGGFLILTAEDPTFRQGFDDWVEDMETLKRYFEESQWEIEWLD